MEDYPRTVMELEERFSTEEACRDYLIRLRWPVGFVCPRCQASGNWTATRGRLICRACRHQASVTAGTILQDTRKPLRMWFRAAWHITSQKNGASAVSLQQELGLGSYITAWTWLHKGVRPVNTTCWAVSGRRAAVSRYDGGGEATTGNSDASSPVGDVGLHVGGPQLPILAGGSHAHAPDELSPSGPAAGDEAQAECGSAASA